MEKTAFKSPFVKFLQVGFCTDASNKPSEAF